VLWQRLDAIVRSGTAVVASAAAPDTAIWKQLGMTPLDFDLTATAPAAPASAPEVPATADPDAIDLTLEHA
jgi:hypothetical protein